MVSKAKIFCIQAHTKVFQYISDYVSNFLKHILTDFHCTKYNENNICHSGVQKHVSCTGSLKRFLIYYGLCLEMAGNVFSIVFHSLLVGFA